MTVVCDLLGGTVEFVAQDRKIESLEDYCRQFTAQQLERIRAVAMDMWEPYFKATIKHVPGAQGKIVHDRFHIMQHVGQAVDAEYPLLFHGIAEVGLSQFVLCEPVGFHTAPNRAA